MQAYTKLIIIDALLKPVGAFCFFLGLSNVLSIQDVSLLATIQLSTAFLYPAINGLVFVDFTTLLNKQINSSAAVSSILAPLMGLTSALLFLIGSCLFFNQGVSIYVIACNFAVLFGLSRVVSSSILISFPLLWVSALAGFVDILRISFLPASIYIKSNPSSVSLSSFDILKAALLTVSIAWSLQILVILILIARKYQNIAPLILKDVTKCNSYLRIVSGNLKQCIAVSSSVLPGVVTLAWASASSFASLPIILQYSAFAMMPVSIYIEKTSEIWLMSLVGKEKILNNSSLFFQFCVSRWKKIFIISVASLLGIYCLIHLQDRNDIRSYFPAIFIISCLSFVNFMKAALHVQARLIKFNKVIIIGPIATSALLLVAWFLFPFPGVLAYAFLIVSCSLLGFIVAVSLFWRCACVSL